jgi:hypothetical protein
VYFDGFVLFPSRHPDTLLNNLSNNQTIQSNRSERFPRACHVDRTSGIRSTLCLGLSQVGMLVCGLRYTNPCVYGLFRLAAAPASINNDRDNDDATLL